MDYSTLTQGQTVGILYRGSPQGLYTVKSINKMCVVLNRVGDGYERTFSVKTRVEKNSWSDRYTTAEIVSVEKHADVAAALDHHRKLNEAWADVGKLTAHRNVDKSTLDGLKAAIQKVEELLPS